MLVKDLKEFIFENYYKWIGCAEEDSWLFIRDGKEKIYYYLLLSYQKNAWSD